MKSPKGPRQLTGLLQNFIYHAAIPQGETVNVAGVQVTGDGESFYYFSVPSTGSLIRVRDWAYSSRSDPQVSPADRENTIATAEPGNRDQSEPRMEQAQEGAEGPSTGASGQGSSAQDLALAQEEVARATLEGSGQTSSAPPTSQAETRGEQGAAGAAARPGTVSSGATSGRQTNPAPQTQPGSSNGAERSSANRSSDPVSVLYQPYPEDLRLAIEQLRRLPDVPQLGRAGRRNPPWGHKRFGRALGGTTAGAPPPGGPPAGGGGPTAGGSTGGGQAKPTGANGTTKVTKKLAAGGGTRAGDVPKNKPNKTAGVATRMTRRTKVAG